MPFVRLEAKCRPSLLTCAPHFPSLLSSNFRFLSALGLFLIKTIVKYDIGCKFRVYSDGLISENSHSIKQPMH